MADNPVELKAQLKKFGFVCSDVTALAAKARANSKLRYDRFLASAPKSLSTLYLKFNSKQFSPSEVYCELKRLDSCYHLLNRCLLRGGLSESKVLKTLRQTVYNGSHRSMICHQFSLARICAGAITKLNEIVSQDVSIWDKLKVKRRALYQFYKILMRLRCLRDFAEVQSHDLEGRNTRSKIKKEIIDLTLLIDRSLEHILSPSAGLTPALRFLNQFVTEWESQPSKQWIQWLGDSQRGEFLSALSLTILYSMYSSDNSTRNQASIFLEKMMPKFQQNQWVMHCINGDECCLELCEAYYDESARSARVVNEYGNQGLFTWKALLESCAQSTGNHSIYF